MSNSIGIRSLSPYLLIAIFLIFKLTHLGVSFFWDESWVYAPALKAMAEAGPSLLPDAISLDYSRGHPLLFHFLGGLWIKIFGQSFVAMHSYALMISIFFLLYANLLLKKFKLEYLSLLVLLVLCVQPMFVAQSSMVLPEMLLATLSIAAIYYYAKGAIVPYIISGILTILTKETGILVIGVIVVYDFIVNLLDRTSLKQIIRSALLLSLPLITLLAHMLYLKSIFGWYLYPEHTGMIKSDLFGILSSFFRVIHDQIFYQQRFLIAIPFVLLYGIHLLKSKHFVSILVVMLSLVLGGFTYKFYGDHFPLSLLFLVFIGHFSFCQFIKGSKNERLLLLFFLFLVVYAIFSAANFYTVRYLLSTLIFTLIIPIYFCISKSILKKWLPYYFMALAPVFLFQLFYPEKINDVNLTYLDYCPAQLEVVSYFEENELYDEQINTMFLMSVALNDKKAGYRQTEQVFRHVNSENNKGVDYFIFYNVESDNRREGLEGTLVKRIESGHVWFEIWKVGG